MNRSELVRLIARDFATEEDFAELLFEVDLELGQIPGRNIPAKARELLTYMERRGKDGELLAAIAALRPHLQSQLETYDGWRPGIGIGLKKDKGAGPSQPDKTGTTAAPEAQSGMTFENFDLRIRTKDEDGRYRMEVTRNPEGMDMFEDVKQSFPLDDYDFMDLVDYLSDLIADENDAKKLGQRMYELLFPDRIGDILFSNMSKMRQQRKGLRIRLRVDPPELSKLPWEYVHGGDDFGFLALDPRTPMVRYISRPFQSQTLTVPKPMKVLLAISAPIDQEKLNVDEEERRVRTWLNVMEDRVKLTVLRNATPERLQAALTDSPHIFHFIGHGEFVGGVGKLVLENSSGKSEYRDSEQLKVLMQGRDVKVVILNACKSAAGSSHAAFAGMAPALVQADIPAVVAMQFNVPDLTALGFTQDLYRYLMSGYPLDQAVTEMRVGAFNVANDKKFWGIPVLYMRSPDGRLWEPDAELFDKFNEAKLKAIELIKQPSLTDSVQKIIDEVNDMSGIDVRDKEYIVRGLGDGKRAIEENNVGDVEYYLNRTVDDIKRSRSTDAEAKLVPMVDAVIRRAKVEMR